MKRNIRLRYCLAQIIHTFSFPKPRYSGLLAVLATMCLYAHAQSPEMSGAVSLGSLPDTVTPLQIGDTIPEYLWHLPLQVVNHPEGKEMITLDEYRDKKLIILDFWAIWCSPCIKSVEHIDTLITNNSLHDAVLIPVSTYDYGPKVPLFMEKRGWKTFSVVKDKVLCRKLLTAYRGILGVVWLKDGKLYAVPRKASITLENVHAAMDSTSNLPLAIVNFPLKATEGQ